MRTATRAVFAAIFAWVSLCVASGPAFAGGIVQSDRSGAQTVLSGPEIDARAASLETLVGQMVMLGFRGTFLEADSPIRRDIAEGHLGGVIFFDRDMKLPGRPRNIVSPEQTRAFISAMRAEAKIPLFVAVDQEGGKVRRLKPEKGFMNLPSAADLGKGVPENSRECAANLGAELRYLGFNMDFAPVSDIAVTADSPAIGRLGRAFSADPEIVIAHNRAFLKGLASAGVIGCLKHFPGHGSALRDTHLGVTDITKTWRPMELAPYERLIREGVVPVVMVGHLYHADIDPRFPASLSSLAITGLLRSKLGFEGVVISDDLQMKAVWDHFSLRDVISLSVQAGTDILLFGNNMEYDPDLLPKIQGVMRELVENGTVSRERLEQSYIRIMRLKSGLEPAQRR